MNESKREEVYRIFLDGNEYTSKQISDELDIPFDNVSVYLDQYKKDGKIEVVDKIGRFNIYKIIPREERKQEETVKPKNNEELINCLKFLNDLFKDNFNLLSSRKSTLKYIVDNTKIFDKIEEVIKDA